MASQDNGTGNKIVELREARGGAPPSPPTTPPSPPSPPGAPTPEQRFVELLRQERFTHDVLIEAQEVIRDNVARDPRDLMRWKMAQAAWLDIRKQVVDAESSFRRQTMESGRDEKWQEVYDGIFSSLSEHYPDEPQYSLLCERVAGVTVRLRQMETSGRDIESHEYSELLKTHASIINQLQKYTESTKAELIKPEVQKAMTAVLELVERHLSSRYPELWADIFEEVVRLARDLDAA